MLNVKLLKKDEYNFKMYEATCLNSIEKIKDENGLSVFKTGKNLIINIENSRYLIIENVTNENEIIKNMEK